jgi:hypothetical protein
MIVYCAYKMFVTLVGDAYFIVDCTIVIASVY